MRRTRKYLAARKAAFDNGIVTTNDEHATLYDALQKQGFNWDSKLGTWSKDNAWQGSAFQDAHDQPTGVFKVRVMGHPAEIDAFVQEEIAALKQRGRRVISISETYQNRRGVGVRVYIDVVRP